MHELPLKTLELLSVLESEFLRNADVKNAEKQKVYMRNQFAFYGLTAGNRREVTLPFLMKNYLPAKEELSDLVKALWEKPEREYHHFALDLLLKYTRQLEVNDIVLFEYMVTHNSWWDTVDVVADKLMGAYFKKFPESRQKFMDKWLKSNNLWLQRSTLLFQLKYKTDTDTEMLCYCINNLLGSKEFFINKAIGWVLRQYSKTNPRWVIQFSEKTNLSPLSRKEALRLIK
tara:strand:- start:4249 stop:4938 length:690 start_codon:yes stop_codon:yes gene_type:complete